MKKLVTLIGLVLLTSGTAQAYTYYTCAANEDGLYERTVQYEFVGHKLYQFFPFTEVGKEFLTDEDCSNDSAQELSFLPGLYSAKGCAEMGGMLLPSARCAKFNF